MPNYKRIKEGDAPPTPQTPKELSARIAELEAIVVDFQKQRSEARQTLGRDAKMAALAETNEAFQAALDELAATQKDLYRMLHGGTAGQTVAVGSASEASKAGGK